MDTKCKLEYLPISKDFYNLVQDIFFIYMYTFIRAQYVVKISL